jgi:hypothetical protein
MIQNFLLGLSGDDFVLINKSSEKSRKLFTLIGLLVILIIIISFFGWLNLFLQLFPLFFAILLSIFFTWMTSNIYLLILYTLSKNLLPNTIEKNNSAFSIAARYFFLLVIGTIISSSLGLLIFSTKINNLKSEYRIYKIQEYKNSLSSYYNDEIVDIQDDIYKYKNDPFFNNLDKVLFLEKKLEKKIADLKKTEKKIESIVAKSNFTIYSIIVLHKRVPEYWLFYILFIIIFTFPAFVKYFIKKENEYYQLKKYTEMKVIEDEYESFKSTYTLLLSKLSDSKVEWREIYQDPPYNTKRKQESKQDLLDQDLLLKELYHG